MQDITKHLITFFHHQKSKIMAVTGTTVVGIKKLTLERKCPTCGKVQELELTFEDYNTVLNARLINAQTVPFLNASQREFFISGLCDYCWEELMK